MNLKWTTEKRKVMDLIPADYNPRRMTEDQAKELRKSLERFDLVEIPAADADGTILAGHQRLAMLVSMGRGEEMIDVRVPNRKLTDGEAKEYNLRSNKNTGEWDMDKLFAMPKELLAEVGFDAKAIQKLIDGHTEVKEDDYNVDEGLKTPVRCERGEIWQLGTHRLMCGDSTAKEDVERLMDGKKADMAYCDPPYGMEVVQTDGKNNGLEKGTVGIVGAAKRGTYSPVIGDDSTDTALVAFALCKDIESVVFWGANFYASALPDSSGWICWDKDNGEGFFADGELAWTNKEKQLRIFRHQWKGMIKASERGQKRVHPTQKPIALAVWCFENYGNPKTVLDLFGGSGSTLIACEQTGRNCYMMELDPKYCTVILDRWEKLTGKTAIKI